MPNARDELLDRIMVGVARDGLADRSLRDIATSAATSHRMVLYHFGDRDGLIAAIVARTEADQRQALLDLATEVATADELILALWRRVSSEEMRPFVRLFFEVVAIGGTAANADAWLGAVEEASQLIGDDFDADRARLGVAVTRGLLIDVLTSGSTDGPDRAIEQFIGMWSSATSDEGGNHD